ncbi:MAG: hypothetical protein ACM33T_01740 [Solirubrobacterales bacterium]
MPHLLECRYDGPIPPADPAMIGRPDAVLRARLFERLAAEARRAAALRRARLGAAGLPADHHLSELGQELSACRRQALAWRHSGMAAPAPAIHAAPPESNPRVKPGGDGERRARL